MEAKENIARELGLLRGSTQQLEQTWQISGIPIKTTIPFIGWLVTLGKRCIRKSVHWLIAPYWEQQTAFNHTTMEAISELYRIQNGLCGEQPGNLLDGYQRQVNDQQGQIEQYRAEIEKWAEVLLRIDATVREGFSECREKLLENQNRESDRSDKQNAILYAYRYLLGREPENTDIVLYNEKGYQELKQTFESAPEYLLKHNGLLQMDALTTKELIKKFDFQIDYEAVLEKNYSKLIHPGDTVVDIGAHVGRHLRVFERLVTETGSLYGFEPLKKQYGYLTETFQAENVRLFNLALSNFNGEAEFWECENYPEESGLQQRAYNHEDVKLKSVNVQVKQLDDFLNDFTRLDYVKMDAEGAEVDILEGAARVISKFRPIISTEYGGPGYGAYGRQRRSLFDLCEKNHYSVTDIFGNPIFDLSEWEECCDSVYWDYFLVPREKLAKFLFCLHN